MYEYTVIWFMLLGVVVFYCAKMFKEPKLYSLSGIIFSMGAIIWLIYWVNPRVPLVMPVIALIAYAGVWLIAKENSTTHH